MVKFMLTLILIFSNPLGAEQTKTLCSSVDFLANKKMNAAVHLFNIKEGHSYPIPTGITTNDYAENMKRVGMQPLLHFKVLEYLQSILPAGGAILEIGPWLNPLGNDKSFAKYDPWFVYDFDSNALQKISMGSPGTRQVFPVGVDLVGLERSKNWQEFFNYNAKIAGLRNQGELKFSIILATSVFNYVSYKDTLRHLIPKLTEGGLVLITNPQGVGTHGIRHNDQPKFISEIHEFLLTYFPQLIRFVDGIPLELEDGLSIVVAVKGQPLTGVDYYLDATQKLWRGRHWSSHEKKSVKDSHDALSEPFDYDPDLARLIERAANFLKDRLKIVLENGRGFLPEREIFLSSLEEKNPIVPN
jgi:hypothetical protein